MPDNLPPSGWGPESFDDRDLDAVLDGKTGDVTDRLRPVADLLAALRVGPAPAELHGETAAMAEFRALGLGQPEHLAGPEPTRVLEALPGGQRARRPGRQPARHRMRPRRRPARRAVLASVAAAAVIALAVLITGNITGSFGDIAHMASPSAGTRSSASTGHAAPREEISSSALETTSPPSATYSAPPAPTPSEICHAFYTGLIHPGLSAWATQESLWEQLTKLANSSSSVQVFRYCAPYVKDLFPAGQNQAPHPGPGYQNSLGQQDGAPANSRSGSSSDQGSSGQGNSQGTPATPAP